MRHLIPLSILLMFLATGCYTQYRAPGAVGKVIDAQTGVPVRGARVTRSPVPSPPYLVAVPAETVVTDKSGAFNLPPNSRTVIRFMHLHNFESLSGSFIISADGYATNELHGTATPQTFWRAQLGKIFLKRLWPTSSKATFFRISDWDSVEAELGKSFEDDVENPFKRSKLFKQIKSGHDQQMFIEMTMQSDHLMVPLAGFLCLKEQSHEEVVVKTAMCIILESKHPASPVNAPIFEFLRTRKDMALSNAFADLATRAGTNVNLTILLSVLSNDWLYDWFHNSQTTLCSTAEATVLDELIGRSQKNNQKLSPKMIAELNKMQFVPGFPRAIFVLYSGADKPILMTNLKSVLEDQSINDATMLALIARKRDLIEELLLNDSTLSQQARTRVEQFLNKIKKH